MIIMLLTQKHALWYGDCVGSITKENSMTLFPNPNLLIAASKCMQTVILCTNKDLQFLTVDVG